VSRRWKVAAIAAAAVLGAIPIVLWLASWLRWVDRPYEIGFQGEARRNPLLAAQRLFDELGLPARSRAALGELPPEDHLLVLRETGRFAAPATVERLLGWIEGGGNLLVLFPSEDELLESLEDDLEEGRFELPVARELEVRCVLDSASGAREELDLGQGREAIDLRGRLAFEDVGGRADVVVGERMRARLLSFEHGLGRVTLAADDTWATNERIDEEGHARILWQLAQLEGRRTGALLVYGERPPGLLATLFEHGSPVLAGLAALVALQLWRVGLRFGPRLSEPPRSRRDFSEHVVAAGELWWRHRAAARLLDAPRAELRRRLGLRRPQLARLGQPELARELARLAELPEARAARALAVAATHEEHEFTEVVRDLSTIRKAL
jgi:hypothetical protein